MHPLQITGLNPVYEVSLTPDDRSNQALEWLRMSTRNHMPFTFNYKTAIMVLVDSNYGIP